MQLIHEEDRKRVLQFNKKMMEAVDGEVGMIEYRLHTVRGTTWVRNKSKAFKRSSDGIPTHLISVIQDFTEEVALRKELEERTHYAETIFEASVNQMLVLDKDFRILSWNRRSEEITGIKKEVAIGHGFFELFPKLKEDVVIYGAFQAAATGQLVQLPPKRALYTNGIYERFFLPLKNSQGETTAILLMVHDVSKMVKQSSELLELNKTLEKKNKELAQKQEEILHFSFVASHDLKEPLRKLYMFSDWLLQNELDQLSETGHGYLERMKEAVLRLELLIEDILVLTKIHADSHIADTTDLQEVLTKAKDELQAELNKSGAKIEADNLPVLKGNANQLLYLFKNLLSNSLKFQAKGNRPHIQITAAQVDGHEIGKGDDEFLKLSFNDNGLGFDSRYTKKIFQVFQRLHTRHHFEGTGIGLAVCKKIMDNHNGYITANSSEGNGATFHCYFPLVTVLPAST